VRGTADDVARQRARAMKPRPFDYAGPDTVDEAVALLAEHGDEARVLAGGQSLMAMMNLRLADPAVLVDIARIAELDTIRDRGDSIEVGAAVTQNKLLAWPELQAKLPLLAVALPFVGHFQTRNRGTVCGSIAHADPSSELPLALALADGEVVLRSARGERVLTAKDFQRDMLTTARAPDELVVAVRFPVDGRRGVAFREVARRHGDFAIIAVAAVFDGKDSARLGIGGMTGTPVVRSCAVGGVKDTVETLAKELDVTEDLHASAEMRRDILRNLAPIVVEEARRCAA
jgi:2-furoyl-CoA dehydrogenase FAD binding subunit